MAERKYNSAGHLASEVAKTPLTRETMPTQGRKYASRACVQCRKKKRRVCLWLQVVFRKLIGFQCDGEDCTSCAKENIECVMDLDTDQRRQINRNNRNTRDKLPDNLLTALRTASQEDAESLFQAVRDNASSRKLETLIERFPSNRDDEHNSLPSNPPSTYETAEWLHTPTNSENFDEYTLQFQDGEQDIINGDRLGFGSTPGIHIPLRSPRTDRLSQVMRSFREAASSQILAGARVEYVLSTTGIELDMFFRDRTDQDSHTVSTWACEFAKSWTLLSPVSQLAVIHFAAAFIRWFILPCRQTYSLMSTILRPLDGDSMAHDSSEEESCRAHGVEWINSVTMDVHQLTWPYPYMACFDEPVAGNNPQSRRLSRLFIEYCDDSNNWNRSSID